MDRNKTQTSQKQSLASLALDYLEMFVLAAAVVMLLFTFSIRLCRVDGDSMFDTLENGQMLVASDLAYTPESGDVVIFHQSNNKNVSLNKPLVKRVIATEGQWFKIVYRTVSAGKPDAYVTMEVYVSDDEIIDESDRIDESYIDFKEIYKTGHFFGRYDVVCQPATDESYVFADCVPKGMLFVMGDNRFNSNDSRLDVGYVDSRCVLGKIIFRLNPLGTVN